MSKEANETVGKAEQLVSFGEAIKALKEGKRVCRSGWNGKNLFIFMQVPSRVNLDIVPKMTSLPQSVKNEFQKRLDKSDKETGGGAHNHSTIDYSNQVALVNPDNTINGWSPSITDALADDWIILE